MIRWLLRKQRCFLFFLLFSQNVFAQLSLPLNLRFNKFTSDNGLSDNNISDILKDKQGYLWIATQNGLDRFDGVEFKSFLHNPTDTSSILSNYVEFLALDSLGRIWAATAGGLSVYNPSTGRFFNYRPSEDFFFKSRVYKVICAKDGSIWFSTWAHLHHVDLRTMQFTHYLVDTFPVDKNTPSIHNFDEDHNGDFWFGNQRGLILFHIATHSSTVMDAHYGFSSLYIIGDSICWLGSWVLPFRKYEYPTKQFTDFFFDNDDFFGRTRDVMSIEHIPYKGFQFYLWLGTNAGLTVFDMHSDEFIRTYRHDPQVSTSLPLGIIHKIFYDANGILWLGTDAGLYYARLNQFGMQWFFFPEQSQCAVKKIREDIFDHSRLWVIFYQKGLFEIDKNSGAILKQFVPQQKVETGLNYMLDFVQDSTGIMWIASEGGLIKYNPETGRWQWKRHNSSGDPLENGLYEVMPHGKNALWFVSDEGLGEFNERTDSFRFFQFSTASENKSGSSQSVYTFCKDFKGNIWLPTEHEGMYVFNPETEKFKSVSIASSKIFNPVHQSVAAGPEGTIYYSDGEQLFFRKKTDTAFQPLYSEKMDGAIFHLASDIENVYMAMQSGLLVYEKATGKFIKYTTADGLQQNKLYYGMEVESDGEIYLHGDGGFTLMNFEKFTQKLPPAPLVMETFTIGYRDSVIDFDAYASHPFTLSYKQNQFAVSFRQLNFNSAQLVRYYYMLDGWDKDWNITTVNRVSYSHLSGGNYTLRVKAVNGDGTLSTQQATMMFHVDAPFWETWWFYLLCLLAISAILYGLYRIRINRILAVQRVRNLISRDLHDDVGSTLSSIRMLSALAKKKLPEDQQKTSDLLEKITDSSTRMTETMQDIVWAVNPDNDSFESIIARMQQFAAESFEAKNIELHFHVDAGMKALKLPLEHRRDFFLIYKEAVNNISKYSGAQQGKITLSKNHHSVQLKIEDDGIGFNKNVVLNGNGLRNMRERAKNLNGNLSIHSEEGKGTQVILEMKI